MKKNQDLYQIFVNELEEIYNAEQQIVEALPKLVQLASLPDLKEALTHHLKETKQQVQRLEKIFSILGERPEEGICKVMESLLQGADEFKNDPKSPALDAEIISAAQKVEHFEMASYGTLRSFADHLGFDSSIASLLQETLNEEGAADKKLTKIAEGSFFSSGVNKEAASATASKKERS